MGIVLYLRLGGTPRQESGTLLLILLVIILIVVFSGDLPSTLALVRSRLSWAAVSQSCLRLCFCFPPRTRDVRIKKTELVETSNLVLAGTSEAGLDTWELGGAWTRFTPWLPKLLVLSCSSSLYCNDSRQSFSARMI